MFYRYALNDVRLPIDLEDIFRGGSCFIVGGAPDAKAFGDMAYGEPVHVLAINNAGTVVKPTLWVGGDKPACYSNSILMDPTIMKFGIISRRREQVFGKPWAEWANTYFFGTTEEFTARNFLNRHRDLAWWKNTFFIAVQLAYRLGFRQLYFAGCGFKISKEEQYAWETKLDDDEVKWNQRLYDNSLTRFQELMPIFEERGLKVTSCTPGSRLNDLIPFVSPESAIDEELDKIPPHDTIELPHSSKVSKEE